MSRSAASGASASTASWQQVRPAGRVRADNGDALREMAIAGLGVAVLPMFIVGPALADGRLVAILGDHPLQRSGLYAVMPPGRGGTARVRALVDHLAAWFARGTAD